MCVLALQQQCERYWHNQHARYDDIDVWLESTHVTADVIVRTFRIAKQVLSIFQAAEAFRACY